MSTERLKSYKSNEVIDDKSKEEDQSAILEDLLEEKMSSPDDNRSSKELPGMNEDNIGSLRFEHSNASNTKFSMEYTMKYFRHYKGMPYMYKGIAKHSETLEDMVVYEAKYENAQSKLWVRPKKMFFEQVQSLGEMKARFEQVPLFVQKLNQISDEDIAIVKHLSEQCFGVWNEKTFRARLETVESPLLILAYIDTRPVAFKIGYHKEDKVFYSWLGGVVPEYHRFGFARQLALIQIEWCKKRGYKKIEMKSKNKFKAMIALNLSLGFDIVGTEVGSDRQLKILLEKKL